MKLISQYIAPWALPKEAIPLHLMWEKSILYDSIRISIPPEIVLKEFFNVDDYIQKDNLYIIKKLKTSNFFGLTVASKDIIKEQHVSRKISITLIRDNTEIFSKDFIANIYRPYVSFVESPESITITEETRPKELLPITLKLAGFGQIQVKNEVSTGGEFIERAEPLYREIIRRMISSFRQDEVKEEDKGIKVNPIFLQNKAKEYIERIERRDFPLDIETKDLEDFRNWVIDENNREKVMELISRNIERRLIDSLLFYFERYPMDNVQMPQGKPVIFIERATQEVRIRFRYRDAMLNEYEPFEIAININDKRNDKTRPLEIPINIKWIFEMINPLEVCR